MVRSLRLAIAEAEALRLRKRLGPKLIGGGVMGSVGRGDDRSGSDVDLVVITRFPTEIRPRIVSGVPVTFLVLTPDAARDEVFGSRKDLNGALAGWRSLKPLHDPTKLLTRLRRRSFHPTSTQFRKASRRALLETFEDLGKLRNAIEAGDREEMREMAIWFTDGAIGALFNLERYVLPTGRRAFIDARRYGRVGQDLQRLRYGGRSPAEASRLAEAIWSDLIRRAGEQRIGLPELLRMKRNEAQPKGSRLAAAERFVRRVRRREGPALVAAGLYGSVAIGEDRSHSDIDVLLVVRDEREYPRISVFDGFLLSISEKTPAEIREEVTRPPWNMPEALSGWRSMRVLYDPSGLLRRVKARSRHPSDRAFKQAALENILAGYEDLEKVRKALRARDLPEAREMAIWFSLPALMAFLCLERHVVTTGRRLLAETRSLGPLGHKIYRLRTQSLRPEETMRLAHTIWVSLLARARRERIRLPKGLEARGHPRHTS